MGTVGLICQDDRLKEGKREYERTFTQSVNYLCTNPWDYAEFKKCDVKLIEVCIIGMMDLICMDPRLSDGKQYERTFTQGLNYVCTNAKDYHTAREYKDDHCD